MATVTFDNRISSTEEDKLHNQQTHENYVRLVEGKILAILQKGEDATKIDYPRKSNIIQPAVQGYKEVPVRPSIINKSTVEPRASEINRGISETRQPIIISKPVNNSYAENADSRVERIGADNVIEAEHEVINDNIEDVACKNEEEVEEQLTIATMHKSKQGKNKKTTIKIDRKSSSFLCLTKKDRVIFIATICTVVVLLASIIFASTIVSKKSNQVQASQKRLNEVVKLYEESNKAKNEYLNENYIPVVVNDFATSKGMTAKR